MCTCTALVETASVVHTICIAFATTRKVDREPAPSKRCQRELNRSMQSQMYQSSALCLFKYCVMSSHRPLLCDTLCQLGWLWCFCHSEHATPSTVSWGTGMCTGCSVLSVQVAHMHSYPACPHQFASCLLALSATRLSL